MIGRKCHYCNGTGTTGCDSQSIDLDSPPPFIPGVPNVKPKSCGCATKIKKLKEEIETRKESERRAWSEVACLNNERASYCVRAEKSEPKLKEAINLLQDWLMGAVGIKEKTHKFVVREVVDK